MKRPRLAVACLACAAVALVAGGCASTADTTSQSRVAVYGESLAVTDGPVLGAGDALGRGMHEIILARLGGGETYATMQDSPEVR